MMLSKTAEVRLETGESIPCASLEKAEKRALYTMIYDRPEKIEILENGKIVTTLSATPEK